jgi:hypothetical protein
MADDTVQFYVGEGTASDTTSPQAARGTRLRELLVNLGAPIKREATSRGRMFSISTALTGVTLAAGMVAPGAGATTLLSLYNPPGSSVSASITRAWLCHISGTPGAGMWSWYGSAGQVITQTTAGLAGRGKVSGGASQLTGYVNVALTGSTAQSFVRPFPSAQFAAILAATSPGQVVIDEVDGAIEVGPGSVISLAPPAAGTTHIVACGFEYQEIPA